MEQDEWSEAKCLLLIRGFKERPILWDHKNPLFYKKALKPRAWEEIAQMLNFLPHQCRHKMVILMSSFRREKAKMIRASKSGKDHTIPFQSTWFAFKAMSFLLEKNRKSTVEPVEVLMDDDDSEKSIDGDQTVSPATEQDSVQDINEEVDPFMENNQLDMRPRKRPAVSDKNSVNYNEVTTPPVLENQQHPSTSHQNEEEIKYFSRFIASKMMKYSENVKNVVQQAICEVIFRADQSCFEQNSNETYARSQPMNQPSIVTAQQPNCTDFGIKMHYSDSD